MSKYNHIKSIPIEKLSKEEIKEAIKEWAEGDKSMEELLWACYNNNIKTSGCHAGSHPYLGIEYEKEKKDKIAQLLDVVLSTNNTRILLSPDGGNPFSRETWYKPDISLGSDTERKEAADQLLNKMSEKIRNPENQNTNYSQIINLFDFLIDKYSGIKIHLLHTHKDEYIFIIRKMIPEEEIGTYEELNQLFTSVGLLSINNDTSHKEWTFKSSEQKDFIERLNKISEVIINKYSLKKPESIEETSSFIIQAHIKRDEYIREGKEKEFELWLMEEERKLDEEMEKRYRESKKQGSK